MLCRTQLRPYFTDVLCHEYRRTRLITLNAPKKHNALSLDMVKMLHALYITEPAADDAMYVIKGAGPKSFCAGGDVVALTTAHDRSSSSSNNLARDYFYLEYQVNHRIFTMPQPHVALMHGYVLGGGAGISIPGSLRVATESAIFAMPEIRIGGVPDVGASFFLPRLPVDGLGLLLGLSGHRLRGADVLHAGLATHMANNLMLPQMERELCHVSSREEMMAVVEHHHHRCGTLPDFSLAPYTDWIRGTFSLDANNNVAAIVASVEEEASAHPNDVFLNQLRQALAGASATTLRLTLELFRRGAAAQTPAEALMHEYAVSQHLLTHHDFTEGVRALLIDKDQHPQWCPATLEEVSDASIDAYFAAPTTPWHPTQPLPSF